MATRYFQDPYQYVSDIGSKVTKNKEISFAVLWRKNIDTNLYEISLRANNIVDVSIIAKENGGGGHMNAASFKSKVHPEKIFI